MPADLLQAAALCVFPAMVIVAGLYDITTFTIPNWISVVLAVAFVPAAFLTGTSWGEVGLCVAVGLGCFVLAVGMFAMNWIGGGDAKLMAAAGLWLGWPDMIQYLVFTGLAGGILALSLLALRSAWLRRYAAAGPAWMGRLATPGGSAPYGVAIAVGALAVFPFSPLMHIG